MDCQFLYASKGPVTIMTQLLKSICHSPFKDSHSQPIHTCFPIIASNVWGSKGTILRYNFRIMNHYPTSSFFGSLQELDKKPLSVEKVWTRSCWGAQQIPRPSWRPKDDLEPWTLWPCSEMGRSSCWEENLWTQQKREQAMQQRSNRRKLT